MSTTPDDARGDLVQLVAVAPLTWFENIGHGEQIRHEQIERDVFNARPEEATRLIGANVAVRADARLMPDVAASLQADAPVTEGDLDTQGPANAPTALEAATPPGEVTG